MGRIKLGANVLGAAKKAINDSVQYANERKQFGVLISTFRSYKTQTGRTGDQDLCRRICHIQGKQGY